MRKKDKRVIFLCMVFFLLILLTGCVQEEKQKEVQEPEPKKGVVIQENANQIELEENKVSEKFGENLPVSRALAAKMICLAFYENSDIKAMDYDLKFFDVAQEEWYYPYINILIIEGFMQGDGENFRPLEPLSLSEAQVLIDQINPANKTKIKITEDTKNKPISYSLWCELYHKALEERSGGVPIKEEYRMEEKELVLFATPASSELEAWQIATDQGIYSFSGYALDAYLDKKVKFLVKGNELIEAMEIVENTPVLEGAYLEKKEGSQLTVFMGGAKRILSYDGTFLEETPCIVDLKLDQGNIVELQPVNEKISGCIKKADIGGVELEQEGFLSARTNWKLYEEKDGSVGWRSVRNLICGTEIADYYLKNGEICAAVIRREAQPEKIRAVISQTGFTGYLHNTVVLSFQGNYTMKTGQEQRQILSGETYSMLQEEILSGSRIFLLPEDAENEITIESITRGGGKNPSYKGTIEVEKREDGFVIINEINIEDYLCGVVPSEMPASYGLEAAKVQAVTARSYAFNQFYANRFYSYGANVDDSTTCQVYKNTGENETSTQGVRQTEGICIAYEGDVVSANFFSTSGGSRANSGEVWADMANRAFPAYTPEFASAGKEYTKGDYGDLSVEENAATFFKDWTVEGYDEASGWFRWKIQMSAEELNAIVQANLKNTYHRNPFLVKTLQKNGTYRTRPIDEIGSIQDIRVEKRGQGGNVMELMIQGEKNQVLVLTEYNIRKVLAPVQRIEGREPIQIQCKNDIVMEDYSMMPSAFFAIEKDISPEGKLLSVTFYGGGNGHGVGMSQNGVRGLLEKGYSYDKILKHYFKGIELIDLKKV